MCIRDRLGLLSRQDQVIMTLSYAYGLSNTEVGQVLDMPAGTIKARIHRAKAKIRAVIENPTPAADSSPGSTPVPESRTADQTDGPKSKGSRWLGRKRAGQPCPASAVSTGSLTC